MKDFRETIFKLLTTADDGDYVAQATLAAAMKPEGW
jgi:hypothetical protein